jgi:hypothetical protein
MEERIVRPACAADLLSIYSLQNVPFRDQVFDTPLPSYEEFQKEVGERLAEGEGEQYWVFEEDGRTTGFLWFQMNDGFWFVTIWGRWLKTLTNAAGVVAFDRLFAPRLVFLVRQSNRRMIRVCEDFQFRKVGETEAIYVSGRGFSIGKANYYDITAEEFEGKRVYMASQSLKLKIEVPA